MSPGRAALLPLCGLAVAAPAAPADVLAASEGRPSGRSDLDLSLVNMSTGAPVTLPAGVNTPDADELHPSLNLDGSRVAFERRNGSTLRIVVVDLKTGQTADLFSGFEQAANQQITPAISPDGKTVATGEAFSADARPQVTLTDLSSFPNGPFTHSTYQTQYRFADGTTGTTSNPMITGNLVAFDETPTGNVTRLVVGQIGTTASLPFGAGSTTHGALGAPGGVFTALFDQRVGTSGQRDLAFRTFTNTANVGAHATVPLTQVNSAGFDETRPSFTPDGRYIAFAAEQPSGIGPLMVWDSGTQTFINNASLGTFDVPLDGATTVAVTPVLKITTIVGSQV